MNKDALCFAGTNIPASCLPIGIQNQKRFLRRILQILLAVACTFWMNLAFSQPMIKVVGTADSVIVSNQVAQYLQYLDVRENIRLTVIFHQTMPENYAGFTICVNGADLKKDIGYLNIKVYLDARQCKSLQRKVLAHEMIHVKQYAKGELIVNSKREVMWKGQKYSYHHAEHGDPRPWEREAYRNDIRLVKYSTEQSEILLPASKADTYVDYGLSQNQISDFQQKY